MDDPSPLGPTPALSPAALLAREATSFVARLRLFTPARWAAAAASGGTRADVVHHLCGAFVVAAAETTLLLPRLDSDLVLPDQLAVTADDLVRTGRASLDDVAHLLLHRHELLDEQAPAGLVAELGLVDEDALVLLARRVCDR